MSRRQLTRSRRLIHSLAAQAIVLWLRLVWFSSKIQIIGEDNLHRLLNRQMPIIPCYWHQSLLLCSYFLTKQTIRGLKPGFLISPSVDGEFAAKIVRLWGAEVIRGSSTRTGAQAMRDLYQAISRHGISPANTPDGPSGPIYQAKAGVVMLSQSSGAPVLPLACACRRAWYFNSWDRFMLPFPFNRIVLVIGKPVLIDKNVKLDTIDNWRETIETRLNVLREKAQQNLQ